MASISELYIYLLGFVVALGLVTASIVVARTIRRSPMDTGTNASQTSATEMSEADTAIERWKSEASLHCAPLYIEDYFLMRGHDASTKNATATFVTFEGRYYACTCRHAIEIVQKRRDIGFSPFETLALFFDKTRIPLSLFTAEGLKDVMTMVAPEVGEEFMDLAIADISAHWPLVSSLGKAAIDMNPEFHHEPRWARAQMLAAVGYPEVRKRNVTREDGEGRLFGTMAFIIADKSGDIDRHDRIVLMRSDLGKPHGWFFSGISGGPMYVIQEEKILPVGIIFEGWPQTKNDPPHEELTDHDIMIRGLTLTPENFKRWLIAAGLSA
jgi:hypothetical protein